ncbi:MAG TPA: GNAT family N-acetyltransferase [Rhizomicrobium sp.]|jgi:predicted GNAT family acetyltransferase|nr:GNAT family N-acetyltransferase [Rhizomicrobium sp.]
MAEQDLTDNIARSRFELAENGLTAFATYRRNGNVLVIPHVESPPPLRGKGTADRLMRYVAEHARANGLKLVPTCSYAALWLRRHRDYADVLG